jgi:hypothetical protein
VDDWLLGARDLVAEATGRASTELELDARAAELVLELARIAAHTSGDRRNAPLFCYLAGLAGSGAEQLDWIAAALHERPQG